MPHALKGFSPSSKNELKKIVKTDSWYVYYADGSRQLDLQLGGSSFTLGYGNGDIVSGLEEKLLSISRCQINHSHYTDDILQAAEILCGGVWDSYSWALSGTSAVEAAISMNDEYWKALGKNKPKILSFSFAWHGTSYLTKDMGAPFLLENHSGRCINLNHPKSRYDEIYVIDQILKMDLNEVGCIVFDSATWINGLYGWSEKWWKDIRNICDTHEILMITDDVASCWGKSKSYHPYQTFGYGIQPDISALGKSLAAGYAPIGAAVCNEKVGHVIRSIGSWNYNHTHHPSMIGIYLMLNTYNFIEKNNLIKNADFIENRLKALFTKLLSHGIIDNYRINGAFFALDMKNNAPWSGLSSSISENILKGVCPLNANDEYFIELENTFFRKDKEI